MAYPEAHGSLMRVQEVLLKVLSGEEHWYKAAEILGGLRARCVAGASATRRMATADCLISVY
jgi:hypothetical protein